MRELTISKDSLFLRFFTFCWGEQKNLNICKLFWGTVFFPISFFAKKSACLYVSLLYILISIYFAINGKWMSSVVFFLSSIYLFFLYFFIRKNERKNVDEKEINTPKTPLWWNKVLSYTIEPLCEYVIMPIIDFIERGTDTTAGKRISGIFSLTVEYIRTFKHKYCPLVRVE